MMLLMATPFGKNVSKFVAQRKSWSLIYSIKFQKKCQWNRKASFASLTLCWHLCAMRKLAGEIDSQYAKHDSSICWLFSFFGSSLTYGSLLPNRFQSPCYTNNTKGTWEQCKLPLSQCSISSYALSAYQIETI